MCQGTPNITWNHKTKTLIENKMWTFTIYENETATESKIDANTT